MPSASLKKYLEEIISSKKDKFEDNFDIEWNLFSTLCLIRSEKCLEKKTESEKHLFKKTFSNFKTKTEKLSFFLKDEHFMKDVNDLFENLIKDSGTSKVNKKSSAVARFFFDSAKLKIENWEKALDKFNMALMYCPYSKDATNPSDTLLYAKILLKRSELFCLNLNFRDGLSDVEEAFELLNDIQSEERNLLFCKLLYAKSVYLDLLDFKEYEQKMCTGLIEETIEEFKFNDFLSDKLNKYYSFLNKVFVSNKELIKSECNKREQKIKMNSLKANPKLPGASTRVELCVMENKGRCTRATNEIKDGSILFVEDPVVSWLRPTMYKFYCSNCFTKIQNHFMTCFNCVKIKYCSSKCRDEAWQKYHSVECKFQECLRYLGYGQMALRTMLLFDQDQMMNTLVDENTLERINDVTKNENLNEETDEMAINRDKSKEDQKSLSLESTVSSTETNSKDLSPRAKIERKKFLDNTYWVKNGFPSELDYEAFFSLVGDEKHLSFFQLISFCYGVSLLGLFARKMNIIDKNDRFFYIFHSALLSHILKINFNCYSINDHSLTVDRKLNFWIHSSESTKIGIGVYLSSSIISHSCVYNSNKVSIGSKIIIYANQNIAKGEEITHTYGPSYKVSSYQDRQTMLKNGYLFDCRCNACENKIENYSNAFKCSICLVGPVIWNQDYTNECKKCKVKNQDLNLLLTKLNQTQEQFNEANEDLAQKKWTECKKKLDNCKKLLNTIFYSKHKLDNLYRIYMEYYIKQDKYQKASKCAVLLARLRIDKDDKESLESVLYSLKAISLNILHLKNSKLFPVFQQLPKKNILKIKENYLEILDKFNEINSREIKLIDATYLPFLECFNQIEAFLESVNIEI